MSGVENPAAFPRDDVRTHDGFGISEGAPGMSLRDYFAAHLPAPDEQQIATQQGLDRSRNPHNDSHKPPLRSRDQIVAELRYRAADAMLAARGTS